MSNPTPIFSKERYNLLSSMTIHLRIKISTKRSNIDKMTVGELRELKKQLNKNLVNLKASDLSQSIFEKINRKDLRITVRLF